MGYRATVLLLPENNNSSQEADYLPSPSTVDYVLPLVTVVDYQNDILRDYIAIR